MSNFLINVARRGAGLTPQVRPEQTATAKPLVVSAGIEHFDRGYRDDRIGHPPHQPDVDTDAALDQRIPDVRSQPATGAHSSSIAGVNPAASIRGLPYSTLELSATKQAMVSTAESASPPPAANVQPPAKATAVGDIATSTVTPLVDPLAERSPRSAAAGDRRGKSDDDVVNPDTDASPNAGTLTTASRVANPGAAQAALTPANHQAKHAITPRHFAIDPPAEGDQKPQATVVPHPLLQEPFRCAAAIQFIGRNP